MTEQAAVDREQFDRLITLEKGQARMEAQHDHLDKCIDRLREQITWQTRFIVGLMAALLIEIALLIAGPAGILSAGAG